MTQKYIPLKKVFFSFPNKKYTHLINTSLIMALFILGAAHWIFLFNYGNLKLTSFDWPKESAYLDTLRKAQLSRSVPWQWQTPYYQTEYFLGNPEVILTPDIVLLRWMSNAGYILLHVLLFYTIGFTGTLALSQKYKLNFMAFFIFWLLFNFNGYIVSHLAIGHTQWAGYFLLPWYFLLLLDLHENSANTSSTNNARRIIFMALLLSLLFWNGSLHIAVYYFIFLFLTVFFSSKRTLFLHALAVTFISALLSLGRILPATIPSFRNPYTSGYPTISVLLDALTSLRGYAFQPIGGIYGTLNWWEYDIYIGFWGLALLLSMLALRLYQRNAVFPPPIVLAAIIMALLSMGDTYSLIHNLPLPFSTVERVPSRFFILPFFVLLLNGAIGISELTNIRRGYARSLLAFGLPFMVYDVLSHTSLWHIVRLERDQNFIPNADLSLLLIPGSQVNPIYKTYVVLGWAVSLASFILIIIFMQTYRQENKTSRLHDTAQ